MIHLAGEQADVPVVLAGDLNVVPTEFDIYSKHSYGDDALLQRLLRGADSVEMTAPIVESVLPPRLHWLDLNRPESVLAFELGSKNTFLDRALRVNASAFMYRYDDMVFQTIVGVDLGHGAEVGSGSNLEGLD